MRYHIIKWVDITRAEVPPRQAVPCGQGSFLCMLQLSFRFWHKVFQEDLVTLDISAENLKVLMGPHCYCLASPHPVQAQDPMSDYWGHWSLPEWCSSRARPCSAAMCDPQDTSSPHYSRQTPLKAMLPKQCQVAGLSKSGLLSCKPLNTQHHQSFSSFLILAFGNKSHILCGFYKALSLNDKCKICSSPECLKNKRRYDFPHFCWYRDGQIPWRKHTALWRP